MTPRVEMSASREWEQNLIELRWRSGGNFAKPVEFAPVEPGMWVAPSMLVSPDDAQQMMDELWRIGIRPTEGSGSAGSLAATERHLEDMRKMAYGALRKIGVQP